MDSRTSFTSLERVSLDFSSDTTVHTPCQRSTVDTEITSSCVGQDLRINTWTQRVYSQGGRFMGLVDDYLS